MSSAFAEGLAPSQESYDVLQGGNMPIDLAIKHGIRETVFSFSGSYIIGVLPRERSVRQPIDCVVSCVPRMTQADLDLAPLTEIEMQDCADKLNAMLEYGGYRLLEHFVGHGLIVLANEWYDRLIHWTFILTINKPAALNNLAIPTVSSSIFCHEDDRPPRKTCVSLPVAGSGRFVWFTGNIDEVTPPVASPGGLAGVEVFLPTRPGGAKLLWEQQPQPNL